MTSQFQTGGSKRQADCLVLGAVMLAVITGSAGCGRNGSARVPEDDGARRVPEDFPQLGADVFREMDGGLALSQEAIRGRNTWNLWCAGDEEFWDRIARGSDGMFDLLKTLDSRGRGDRFQRLGLINQPGFSAAQAPDRYGLWLDTGTEPAEIDPSVLGRSSGIMGFRIFPNPAFTADAAKAWDAARDPATGEAKRFYADSKFAATLIRPYRVGVACGACHIAFNPCHPPRDPNAPEYPDLASTIGNQYIREGAVFAPCVPPGSFLAEMLAVQRRGTSDTSRIATDHINNPGAINAIFLLGERERIAPEDEIAGGALALKEFTRPTMPVPPILKDGADSIGFAGAVLRVYVNIGMDSQYWLTLHEALLGLKPQHPFEIAYARQHSTYWIATQGKIGNLAAFFRAAKPYHLADAVENGIPVGRRYITGDLAVMNRGRLLFADNCASCHSSKRPTAESVDDEQWFDNEIVKADFAENNLFSDDVRHSVARIGTNAERACATNAMAGQIWDNFSSATYKRLPSVGAIKVWNPFTEKEEDFVIEGGGPGYYRTPSLTSMWSSAPFFHNNALGIEVVDPSVEGRMQAFNDAVTKLLWPEKRLGVASILRTVHASSLRIPANTLPAALRSALGAEGCVDGDGCLDLGPIPAGTPIDLLANLNPEANPARLAALLIQVKRTLGEISRRKLDDTAAAALMKTEIGPALWSVNKCPDFVTDRGHYFGSDLSDSDKAALIEYLKTL